jgi:hypothetical protein
MQIFQMGRDEWLPRLGRHVEGYITPGLRGSIGLTNGIVGLRPWTGGRCR